MRLLSAARTPRLALACWLFGTCGAAAAAGPAPQPYRAVSRSEMSDLVAGVVKDWARGLAEVQAVEEYIRDTEAWSPRFKAAAGAAGAAFGYFEGGEGSFEFGGWNLSLDTSGRQLHRTIASRNGRLLGIGLGRADRGLSAEAVLGLRHGRFLNQSFNVSYKLRY